MKINLSIINVFSVIAVISIIVLWILHGAEIFTKTKILVDNTSELDKALGIKNEVWVEKFILGLDYAVLAIVLILIITFALNYLLKTKRKES